MIETYINTITTIERDSEHTVVERSVIESITIETFGMQGAKGDKGDPGDGGISFYTKEMNGLSSSFTAEHNLGRPIAVARVYKPDGTVMSVPVKNLDNEGNVSQNVAQVTANLPMVGKLTLI